MNRILFGFVALLWSALVLLSLADFIVEASPPTQVSVNEILIETILIQALLAVIGITGYFHLAYSEKNALNPVMYTSYMNIRENAVFMIAEVVWIGMYTMVFLLIFAGILGQAFSLSGTHFTTGGEHSTFNIVVNTFYYLGAGILFPSTIARFVKR